MDVATRRSALGLLGARDPTRPRRERFGPPESSAHGGDNARDLHHEVTTAQRREDLSEARRQAPDHIQPNVTLLSCWLPPCAFLGLEAEEEAAVKLGRSHRWASLGDLS